MTLTFVSKLVFVSDAPIFEQLSQLCQGSSSAFRGCLRGASEVVSCIDGGNLRAGITPAVSIAQTASNNVLKWHEFLLFVRNYGTIAQLWFYERARNCRGCVIIAAFARATTVFRSRPRCYR